jgi:hypothetical protein
MNEPMYGPVSPGWPGMPSPPIGWLHATSALGQRPFAASIQPTMPQGPAGFAGSALPPHSSGVASALSPVTGVVPIGATVPGFSGSEIAIGVTAPSLLATVAVRRGQPLGPTNDAEVEDFLYDALELLPGSTDVDVRCEGGRVTFTGAVPYKRLKRDVGEIAWSIPAVNDVQNNVTIAARRRARPAPGRENEPPVTATRKTA